MGLNNIEMAHVDMDLGMGGRGGGRNGEGTRRGEAEEVEEGGIRMMREKKGAGGAQWRVVDDVLMTNIGGGDQKKQKQAMKGTGRFNEMKFGGSIDADGDGEREGKSGVERKKLSRKERKALNRKIQDEKLLEKETMSHEMLEQRHSQGIPEQLHINSNDFDCREVTVGKEKFLEATGSRRMTAVEKIEEPEKFQRPTMLGTFLQKMGDGANDFVQSLFLKGKRREEISKIFDMPSLLMDRIDQDAELLKPTRTSPNVFRMRNRLNSMKRKLTRASSSSLAGVKRELGFNDDSIQFDSENVKDQKVNANGYHQGINLAKPAVMASGGQAMYVEEEVEPTNGTSLPPLSTVTGTPKKQKRKKNVYADLSNSAFEDIVAEEEQRKEEPKINVAGVFYQDGKAMTLDEIIEQKHLLEEQQRLEKEQVKKNEDKKASDRELLGDWEEKDKVEQIPRKRKPKKFSMELTPLQAAFRKNNQQEIEFEESSIDERRMRKGKYPLKVGKYPSVKTRQLLGEDFDQLTNRAKSILASKLKKQWRQSSTKDVKKIGPVSPKFINQLKGREGNKQFEYRMNAISVAIFKHLQKRLSNDLDFKNVREAGVDVTRVQINRDLSIATVHWEKTDFSEEEKNNMKRVYGENYEQVVTEIRERASQTKDFSEEIGMTAEEEKNIGKMWRASEGKLRSLLAADMNMKATPELRFKLSKNVSESVKLEKLLDAISEENAQYDSRL
eukprot:Nk52_evm3s1020 gene=Nk52_evmTU3s1020